ncbi:FAD-dependent monooxygenase [Pseudonocardia sichuanensis]
MRQNPTDVVVAGAGPTGLALACGLAAAGVRVRVVDRADGPARTSRANILHARGVQVLTRLDALGDLREQAVAPMGIRMHVRGRLLTTLTFAPDEREAVQALFVSQAAIEQRLRDRLAELGVGVEWGHGVGELAQDPDGVTVGLSGGDRVRAAWLVGCDGAHSRVRTLAGIAFPGVPVVERFLLADVHADGIADREHSAGWYHRDGILMAMPMRDPAGNLWRLMANVPDDGRHLDAPAVVRRFEELLPERAGITGARVRDAVWTSVFRIHRRLADDYRSGRVLLAGDAAHIHSPFGGQGLNTGIGDAENLAWKLALAVRGLAADGLLDTYAAERRPAAADVLRRTTTNTRALVAEGAVARWVRDHVLVRYLDLPAVQRQATRAASQLGLSYRRGPLGGRGAKPRPGDRVRDRPVVRPDGTRSTLTGELGPAWVLLSGGTAPEPLVAVLDRRLPGSTTPVTDPAWQHPHALLVRPDGHLLWRGTHAADLERGLDRVARVVADRPGRARLIQGLRNRIRMTKGTFVG